ncbi:MAG TPA: histone deacetylase [Elusimicrobiales bacterium]|nr:histone deacetylase [Elusimicrobiales bacterium]
MRVIFSPKYTVSTPGHVFRSDKFARTLALLIRKKIVDAWDVKEPARPAYSELALAHSRPWVEKARKFTFSKKDSARAQLEITRAVVEAHLLNVGGTILAAEMALNTGLGLNCGGGAHHAFAGHGEGFCLFNDIAVAIKLFLKKGWIKRALVIDLDAHQGNGTAAIFRNDKRVFTFSMHQDDLYPEKKEKSSLDVELPAGAGDAGYLGLLRKNLPRVIKMARPDLAIYVAGADVYKGDLLGGLKLSMEGIKKRDAFVFRQCRLRGVPVAAVLSGGYAKRFSDTVAIHAGTLAAGIREWRRPL